MHEIKTLDRRTFTLEAALAILSGVTITISGCGGGYNSPTTPSTPAPTPTPTPTGDKVGVISANHGHIAVITGADLTAGKGFTLHIQGQATHNHDVTLSDAEIAAIAANQQVSKLSTTDSGHNHTVTFN